MSSRISVVMGSQSDLETVQGTLDVLKDFGVEYESKVLSAHRTPEELAEYVKSAPARGVQIFIAAAGGSAALAGAIASHTTLPVVGIPIATKDLGGLDSLLSTVQMPAGPGGFDGDRQGGREERGAVRFGGTRRFRRKNNAGARRVPRADER